MPVMRVAAIYDMHGNLPALEAILRDIRQAGVEQLVVGGDLVPGPMPRETLECLLALDIPVQFIQGNGEIDALAALAGKSLARVPEPYREIVRWSAEQLYPEYEQLLASWPKTLRLKVDGLGEVLFCHATPRDDNEIFTRLTPEELLLPVFAGLDAALVVCGHTHMQFDRMIGPVRVVNAGSGGMPFGKTGTDWLLFEPAIQLRHTDYDLTQAAERIRQTNYPQVQDFIEHFILHPPSIETMLQVYAHAKLK